MRYIKLNFFILLEILKGKTTTWEIAEKYDWENKPLFKNKREKEFFLRRKCDLICKCLKRMAQEKIVKISKENGNGNIYSKNVYVVDDKRVVFKKRHKFEDCYSEAIRIKGKNDKWVDFQI